VTIRLQFFFLILIFYLDCLLRPRTREQWLARIPQFETPYHCGIKWVWTKYGSGHMNWIRGQCPR